jgi:hypothetical protein
MGSRAGELCAPRLLALLGAAVLVGCGTNPKDPRLRARDQRAISALEIAVRRETPARISRIACFDSHPGTRICRVSFRTGRPTEAWKLVYTDTSARVRRVRNS